MSENRQSSNLKMLEDEWLDGFGRLKLCWALATEDVKDRFRRSLISVLWVTVSFFLFVGVKVVVFGGLTDMSGRSFAIYLTIGLAAWTFISSMVNDAANSLVRSKTWILSTDLPYSIYMIQTVLRNVINFGLIWIAAIVIWVATIPTLSWTLLSVFPALVVYVITGLWVCAVLGPYSARHRDLLYAIQTAMRLMLFATPIIWVPVVGTPLEVMANINPFYHYIEIVRAPMLGEGIPMLSWMVVGGMSVFGLLVGSLSYIKTRARVPFWL